MHRMLGISGLSNVMTSTVSECDAKTSIAKKNGERFIICSGQGEHESYFLSFVFVEQMGILFFWEPKHTHVSQTFRVEYIPEHAP